MTTFNKNIIESLREEGIYPNASCNGVNEIYKDYYASIAISYEPTDKYYDSRNTAGQWWMVDFGKNVKIKSYQIISILPVIG